MKVILAKHFGMCFGVRDALRKTHTLAEERPVTVLGDLVHNQVVHDQLAQMGVQRGTLQAVGDSPTADVVITAHGASDKDRKAWREGGFRVTDTTCPLVKKAHVALARLVLAGYQPVLIGKEDHVEVRGLIGDFPNTCVIITMEDIARLPVSERYGIISQTTQPINRVQALVRAVEDRYPESEVCFVDTVCQPTKDRQDALKELCSSVELVVVVGGRNSNNTHQLVRTAEGYGVKAYHVSRSEDLDRKWFSRATSVGVTAGTSTLDETVQEVCAAIRRF